METQLWNPPRYPIETDLTFYGLSHKEGAEINEQQQSCFELIDQLFVNDAIKKGIHVFISESHENNLPSHFNPYRVAKRVNLILVEEGLDPACEEKTHRTIETVIRILGEGGFNLVHASGDFHKLFPDHEYPSPPLEFIRKLSAAKKFFKKWFSRKAKVVSRKSLERSSKFIRCQEQFMSNSWSDSEHEAMQTTKAEVDEALAVIPDEEQQSIVNATKVVVRANPPIDVLKDLPAHQPVVKLNTETAIWNILRVHERAITLGNTDPNEIFKIWKGYRDIVISDEEYVTISCTHLSHDWIEIELKNPGSEVSEVKTERIPISFDLHEAIQRINDREHIIKKLKALSDEDYDFTISPIFEEDAIWTEIMKFGNGEERYTLEQYMNEQKDLLTTTNKKWLRPGSSLSRGLRDSRAWVEKTHNAIKKRIQRQASLKRQLEILIKRDSNVVRIFGNEAEVERLKRAIESNSIIQTKEHLNQELFNKAERRYQKLSETLELIRDERERHSEAQSHVEQNPIPDKVKQMVKREGTQKENQALDDVEAFKEVVSNEERISKSVYEVYLSLWEEVQELPEKIAEETKIGAFIKSKAPQAIENLEIRGKNEGSKRAVEFFERFIRENIKRATLANLFEGVATIHEAFGISSPTYRIGMDNAEAAYGKLISALPYKLEIGTAPVNSAYAVRTLLNYTKQNTKFHDRKGQRSERIDDDQFHIHVCSSPEHSSVLKTIPIPHSIFGNETKPNALVCLPGSKGQMIKDNQSGFICGQCIDNNLYTLLGRDSFQTEMGWRIYLASLVRQAKTPPKIDRSQVFPPALGEALKTKPSNPNTSTNQLRDQLQTQISGIEKLDTEILGEGAELKRERFAKEYDKILAHPKIISIDMESERIIVTTKTLYCRDPRTDIVHKIGRFRIKFSTHYDPEKGIKSQIKWENLDGTVNGRYAPHIDSDEIACLGSAKKIFINLLSAQQYYPLILEAIRFVESVNVSDSWGEDIDDWPEEDEDIWGSDDEEEDDGLDDIWDEDDDDLF